MHPAPAALYRGSPTITETCLQIKTNMKTKTIAIAGTVMALLASVPAWGATAISVNYDIAGGNTTSLGAADVAGVVPVDNWNNVQAANAGAAYNYGITYTDDLGASTSLTVAATGGTADTWNTGGTNDEKIFGDKDNLANNSTLTLTNVPYALYDLYIYSSGFGNEMVAFTIGANTQTLVNTFTPQFNPGADPDFVQNDTYVKFMNLTGDSAVSMTGTEIALGGFQIVPVPEPSSTLLIALGGIGLLSRRRRH